MWIESFYLHDICTIFKWNPQGEREGNFDFNIYIMYSPNLGLAIAVLVREREQGCFRGSTEGTLREHGGHSTRAHHEES